MKLEHLLLSMLFFSLLFSPVVMGEVNIEGVTVTRCGDDVCQIDNGETFENCPQDCGEGAMEKFSELSVLEDVTLGFTVVLIILIAFLVLITWLLKNMGKGSA